jgi:hypothetical protein
MSHKIYATQSKAHFIWHCTSWELNLRKIFFDMVHMYVHTYIDDSYEQIENLIRLHRIVIQYYLLPVDCFHCQGTF